MRFDVRFFHRRSHEFCCDAPVGCGSCRLSRDAHFAVFPPRPKASPLLCCISVGRGSRCCGAESGARTLMSCVLSHYRFRSAVHCAHHSSRGTRAYLHQNRNDKQLSPPSILRNSETSSRRTANPRWTNAVVRLGNPSEISTWSFTRTQFAA